MCEQRCEVTATGQLATRGWMVRREEEGSTEETHQHRLHLHPERKLHAPWPFAPSKDQVGI